MERKITSIRGHIKKLDDNSYEMTIHSAGKEKFKILDSSMDGLFNQLEKK